VAPHASSSQYAVARDPARPSAHTDNIAISRQHRWQPISHIAINVTFSCIVLKRQKISTWFLLYTTAPCLFHIAFKFGLHRSPPSSPNFVPKVTYLLLIWAYRRHPMATAAKWLQIAQWSQRRAYRKPPSLFWTVPLQTHYDLPFPQNGGPKSLQTVIRNSRRVLPPGECDRIYRQGFFCTRAMSPYDRFIWPLFSNLHIRAAIPTGIIMMVFWAQDAKVKVKVTSPRNP